VAGKITALRVQKRRKDWVNIFVDGEYAFALPDVKAAKLRLGQHLSDEEIAGWKQVQVNEKAYEQALRLLGHRPRSRYEIGQHLKRKRVDRETVEAVIRRLEASGYLDDEAFARFWVENRERFSPRGKRALAQELRQKGVPDETIRRVLDDLVEDEEGSALRVAEAYSRRWGSMDYQTFRRKLTGVLARRGYDYGVIRSVVRRLWERRGETLPPEDDA
jgi:regulatory protein